MGKADNDALRRVFGLEGSIPIRHAFPSPQETAAQGSFLQKLGEAFGLQAWMLKSWKGVVLALIVVPPAVSGVLDFYKPVITAGIELVEPYMRGLELPSIDFEPRMVQFHSFAHAASPILQEPDILRGTILANTYRSTVNGGDPRLQVWRLVSTRYSAHVLSKANQGYATRWSRVRTPVTMAALSPMHALMEFALHKSNRLGLHGYTILRMALPFGTVPERLTARLPDDWRAFPFATSTQVLGDEWLRQRSALALLVPSVVDPNAEIVLINPMHSDFARIDVLEAHKLTGRVSVPT